MLFQVLCGFEPIFYTTHPNEEPKVIQFFEKKGVEMQEESEDVIVDEKE